MSGLMCFEPSLGLYFWGLLGMIAGIYIVRLGDYIYRRLIASGTPRRWGNTKEPACPICGNLVRRVVRYGQDSYECAEHWGPWEDTECASSPGNLARQHRKERRKV